MAAKENATDAGRPAAELLNSGGRERGGPGRLVKTPTAGRDCHRGSQQSGGREAAEGSLGEGKKLKRGVGDTCEEFLRF